MRGYVHSGTFDIQNVTVHLMLNGGVSVYNILLLTIIYYVEGHEAEPRCLWDWPVQQQNRNNMKWYLKYCFFLWGPYSPHISSSIEKVQFFACKICTKHWSSDYPTLLSKLHLPTLSSRCHNLKLITCIKSWIISLTYLSVFLLPLTTSGLMHDVIMCNLVHAEWLSGSHAYYVSLLLSAIHHNLCDLPDSA